MSDAENEVQQVEFSKEELVMLLTEAARKKLGWSRDTTQNRGLKIAGDWIVTEEEQKGPVFVLTIERMPNVVALPLGGRR